MSEKKKRNGRKNTPGTVGELLARTPAHILLTGGMTAKQADKHIRKLGYDPKMAMPGKIDLATADFSGTCISCMTATDTALLVWGEGEWHTSFLRRAGLHKSEVGPLLEQEFNCDPAKVPVGAVLQAYRVCQRCSSRVHPDLRPGLFLPGGPLPLVVQPGLFPVPTREEVESWGVADHVEYGAHLVDGPHGRYLLPPVILNGDGGAVWGVALVRLIATGLFGSPSAAVVQAPDIPIFEQKLAALSSIMDVPVWPHQEPGRVDAC